MACQDSEKNKMFMFYDTECCFKNDARNIPEDPLGQGLFPVPRTQLGRETGFLLSLNLVPSDE